MIEISNLSLSFADKKVLKDADLKIQDAHTHILLGLSGSGKSTIIKILLGMLKPDKGQVSVDGQKLEWPVNSKWRQQFGYVPQDGGLFPHLTAIDNVTLLARTLKWKNSQIKTRIHELLPLVSIPEHLLKRYPFEISGGQKQRFAIMRALFLNPNILFLDEPLGALDPLIRADLQTEMKKLFIELKKTVIFVTHDVAEAAYLGDEISLLKEGKILQTGTFEDLSNNPKSPFVSRFIQAQRSLQDLKEEGVEI